MDTILLKLNSTEYLPASAYRRNHEIYELVSYVNGLIGCQISKNREGSSLFKSRVTEFVSRHPPGPDAEKYYELINKFIALVD